MVSMSPKRKSATKRKSRSPRKSASPKRSPRKARSPRRKSAPKRISTDKRRSRGMTITQLKAACKARGLQVGGKKETLQQRLRDYDNGIIHPRVLTPAGKRKALGCNPSPKKPCVTKKAKKAVKAMPKRPSEEQLTATLKKGGMKTSGTKAQKRRRVSRPTPESYSDKEVKRSAKKRLPKRKTPSPVKASPKRKSPKRKSPKRKSPKRK